METFPDFVAWAKEQAKTQAAVAEMIGLSESMLSLILSGKRTLLPEHVVRAERASNGLYRCETMLPDVTFVRDTNGIRWLAGESEKAA